jgi:hypothetical protein
LERELIEWRRGKKGKKSKRKGSVALWLDG